MPVTPEVLDDATLRARVAALPRREQTLVEDQASWDHLTTEIDHAAAGGVDLAAYLPHVLSLYIVAAVKMAQVLGLELSDADGIPSVVQALTPQRTFAHRT
jgi:hypothetical protein